MYRVLMFMKRGQEVYRHFVYEINATVKSVDFFSLFVSP